MNKDTLHKLKQLFDQALYAPTKSSAKEPIMQLEFIASSMTGEIEQYTYDKIMDVVTSLKDASGQVKNKDHWVMVAKQSWYKFERNFDL